jgi:nitrile hydratase subunit beta
MSYSIGQRVRVAARTHDGHHRTPDYVKGRIGTIERVHEAFPNPETRAYGGDGLPAQHVYLVGFAQADVWDAYRGSASDRISLDVFESWLEAAH